MKLRIYTLVLLVLIVSVGYYRVSLSNAADFTPVESDFFDPAAPIYLAPASESCADGMHKGAELTFYPSSAESPVLFARYESNGLGKTLSASYITGKFIQKRYTSVYAGFQTLVGYDVLTQEYGMVMISSSTATCDFSSVLP